jgi:TDG/mug DNA glycosylase family protein
MTAGSPGTVLPDLLRPGLRLVFCGSAPSKRSARLQAYYAGPGNRFWPILATAGLTPRQLRPAEFPLLLEHGIGLTDLAKQASGNDAELPPDAYDREGLAQRIAACAPAMLAFTGKAAAAAFLQRPSASLAYGRAPAPAGMPPIWILPSTSGAARGFWDAGPWLALGAWFRTARAD